MKIGIRQAPLEVSAKSEIFKGDATEFISSANCNEYLSKNYDVYNFSWQNNKIGSHSSGHEHLRNAFLKIISLSKIKTIRDMNCNHMKWNLCYHINQLNDNLESELIGMLKEYGIDFSWSAEDIVRMTSLISKCNSESAHKWHIEKAYLDHWLKLGRDNQIPKKDEWAIDGERIGYEYYINWIRI